VAKKYLQLHQSVEAILVPQAAGKPVSARPRGGMESFAPKETKSVELPGWADKALNRLSVPASTVNPEVIVLPNGLKVIIQYASVSDTASVYGHVKNNPYLETPEGKEGLDRVLGPLFSFGTASLDRLTFQKALDNIGAEISVDTDFSLQVLAKHFDRGVELLADNLLHPALPEEAFKTLRKQVADEVAGELESPDYLTKRTLRRCPPRGYAIDRFFSDFGRCEIILSEGLPPGLDDDRLYRQGGAGGGQEGDREILRIMEG
jgi:zinc protease